MVIRKHGMPFGAQLTEHGTVRFRLWAPAASSAELVLAHSDRLLPMRKSEAGWFELVTSEARVGTKYKFRIDRDLQVPDPASRYQPQDVHGPSQVWNPGTHQWTDQAWRGRPWQEAVVYELHVGTFTPEGTFGAAKDKLPYLARLGITAVELMPLSDFFGARNWGYDGVLPFAPDSTYGSPDDLKIFIQSAHSLGLMVLLDVVYNHFGPEGNFLHAYAPQFFAEEIHTPWGAAINFGGPGSRTVREFFIHNALYWLEEFHFDGLRFDAVHAIIDPSTPHILTELASTVRTSLDHNRHIHLVLENDKNEAHYLARDNSPEPPLYTAQWNDDSHHAYHVLLTNEKDGYYVDYGDRPLWHLGRCLTEGFSYQGESSKHRQGNSRGESSRHLPLTTFIDFLQNHDQIGNRAFGDRLSSLTDPAALRAATCILLLSPSPPLLFMGEEWSADTPFLFFCDFQGDLRRAVTDGRRAEFSAFSHFSGSESTASIPDPNALDTFLRSKLDWESQQMSQHREWLQLYTELLTVRRNKIVPLLLSISNPDSEFHVFQNCGLEVRWHFEDTQLVLFANLSKRSIPCKTLPQERQLFSTNGHLRSDQELSPWFAAFFIEK